MMTVVWRTGCSLKVSWVGLVFMFLPLALWAHADLQIQIDALSSQISQNPHNANLFLRRGELYRIHEEWDAAESDFNTASQLDPHLSAVLLARGRMLLAAGKPKSAIQVLDQFLLKTPTDPQALITRARAFKELGNECDAAKDFTFAIEQLSLPAPELYLERAEALASLGEGHISKAIVGLDEGIEKLGPVVSLQGLAIELDLRRKNYEGALERVDGVIQKSLRKEKWLSYKGEILEEARRPEEAQKTFREALRAIESLPPNRRRIPATRKLEAQVRSRIDQPQRK
jgi:predicted Zn-dependent protease